MDHDDVYFTAFCLEVRSIGPCARDVLVDISAPGQGLLETTAVGDLLVVEDGDAFPTARIRSISIGGYGHVVAADLLVEEGCPNRRGESIHIDAYWNLGCDITRSGVLLDLVEHRGRSGSLL